MPSQPRRGRPRLPAADLKTVTIGFRVPASVAASLERMAAEDPGAKPPTRHDVARKIVLDALKKNSGIPS